MRALICGGALRVVLFGLAALHLFPVVRHLPLWIANHSIDEAWKAFGPLVAIAVLAMPVQMLARLVRGAAKRAPVVFATIMVLLAVVHAVPALDHLPRFVEGRRWADAWRGFGALAATAWFLCPFAIQAGVVRACARASAQFALLRLAART